MGKADTSRRVSSGISGDPGLSPTREDQPLRLREIRDRLGHLKNPAFMPIILDMQWLLDRVAALQQEIAQPRKEGTSHCAYCGQRVIHE